MNLAAQVVDRLAQSKCRVVFAESCTCGMVACELGKVPGVSQWLCGSAVTYRNDTKTRWLDVDADTIAQQTAVCEVVAKQMAQGVLTKTPEADLAVSITGHFGPAAPAGFDGVVLIAAARRQSSGPFDVSVSRQQLTAKGRADRQVEATERVFQWVLRNL
ncbi:Nicotinamide-nucleotide amidohydrolase PncC [Rubripirellula lacrimiformis]|uniref:Nicotinamide-nucleotide amidohydrolase PncC n=1 Tax=Rubripirellula lacrimiformis TaxID=1930273 RepID=A0A517NDZ8_9BACT|nr:CinA family protein [Rubripirellula lacrimiformis]QDT05352.1 Nicotinamide-nucleotide amidohydrolase PncC [Rubripirellula lacrimiformis]